MCNMGTLSWVVDILLAADISWVNDDAKIVTAINAPLVHLMPKMTVWKLMTIEHFLYARHRAKPFAFIILYNSHTTLKDRCCFKPPFPIRK